MGFLLQWQNYIARSKDRITANLFSYLSPRWYSTAIIGSNVYDIFNMYADQLSSASLEVEQTFKDLSIQTARSIPIYGQTNSKLYDNFGYIFQANKLFNQDYELYNDTNLLTSYRQQLRFLSEAYLIGSTIDSINKVGQSYTGASPIILEPYTDHIGWRLTSFSASVIDVGKNVLLLDTDYPGIGNILYTNETSEFLGKTLYYSQSRLGYNTNPISKQHYYSGLKIFIYGSSSLNYNREPKGVIGNPEDYLLEENLKIIPVVGHSTMLILCNGNALDGSGSAINVSSNLTMTIGQTTSLYSFSASTLNPGYIKIKYQSPSGSFVTIDAVSPLSNEVLLATCISSITGVTSLTDQRSFIRYPGSINPSFDSSIEKVIKNIVRADIDPIYYYSNNFVYDRYDPGDTILGDTNFTVSSGGFVYNNTTYGSNSNNIISNAISPYGGKVFSGIIDSPTGSLLRSKVISLPSNYSNYNWFYDWSTLLRNDAYFIPQVRSYNSSTIPNTVYYKDIKFISPESLLFQIPSNSIGAHWTFPNINNALDISGNSNNLVASGSSSTNLSLMKPRQGLKLGIYGEKGSYVFNNVTGESLNFFNTDFFIETWLTGIDSSATSNFNYFTIKRQQSADNTNNLTDIGYAFTVNGSTRNMKLEILASGSLSYTLTGSISSLFNELPERPHYFACSYNQGLCFLYVDGKEITNGICTVTPQNVDNGFTYISCNGTGIGVDEIAAFKGQLLPEQALESFNNSKPYQLGYMIDNVGIEQYHQLQLEVHAKSQKEFEYHQFSIRGIDPKFLHLPSIVSDGIVGQLFE